MKDKKEFVPLLENSHQLLSKKSSLLRGKAVIKNKNVPKEKEIKEFQWNEVDQSTSEVKLIENQGTIEGIKVRCRCGCTTLIKLEYDENSSEKILN